MSYLLHLTCGCTYTVYTVYKKFAICKFLKMFLFLLHFQAGIFEKYGVRILGTPIKSIIDSEDRKLFAERIAEIGEQVALLPY